MSERTTDESLYLSEQRRFRRLEVSLPLWLADASDFDRGSGAQWSLGYTRDISMGGAKVIVQGEEEHWRASAKRQAACLIRFDAPGCSPIEYIPAFIRHAAKDDGGQVWLGIEYDEGAQEEKAAALRAGLATMKQRRRREIALVGMLIVLIVAGLFINKQRGDIRLQKARVYQLMVQKQKADKLLSRLSGATLVSTRAEGINNSFQSEKVQEQVRKLTAQLEQLNNPSNKSKVEQQRAARAAADGIVLTKTPVTGVNVNLGVALPYGYAWPQVTEGLEQLLGRSIPTVVIFSDWSAPFPIADCREARVRAKTIQITWEPWHFSNPKAINFAAISSGKYDKYIDSWANAAKSFGGEVWIRFAHEFNGNWYPWSTSANKQNPNTYINAWRHVHDRFTRAGAFNVRWVWCLNAETVPEKPWNDPLRAYPGDQYVDMIAIDGYNFGASLSYSRWQSFAEVFAVPYSRVIKAHPNKPLMVGETGCSTVGGPTGTQKDKAHWILAMDKSLRTIFPRFSGVVWFNVQKEADWRMESSLDSLAANRAVWNKTYYKRGVT